MRCHIECNEEVLCIVVNSCAKHVRSVPAGTHGLDCLVVHTQWRSVPEGTSAEYSLAQAAKVPEGTQRVNV